MIWYLYDYIYVIFITSYVINMYQLQWIISAVENGHIVYFFQWIYIKRAMHVYLHIKGLYIYA